MKTGKMEFRDRAATDCSTVSDEQLETKWSFLLGVDVWAEIQACRDGLQVNERGVIPWEEILRVFASRADLPSSSLD
jgi:hypothetical protein